MLDVHLLFLCVVPELLLKVYCACVLVEVEGRVSIALFLKGSAAGGDNKFSTEKMSPATHND